MAILPGKVIIVPILNSTYFHTEHTWFQLNVKYNKNKETNTNKTDLVATGVSLFHQWDMQRAKEKEEGGLGYDYSDY